MHGYVSTKPKTKIEIWSYRYFDQVNSEYRKDKEALARVLPLRSGQNLKVFPGIFKVCRAFPRSCCTGTIEVYTLSQTQKHPLSTSLIIALMFLNNRKTADYFSIIIIS